MGTVVALPEMYHEMKWGKGVDRIWKGVIIIMDHEI